jgi:hypothetical protein
MRLNHPRALQTISHDRALLETILRYPCGLGPEMEERVEKLVEGIPYLGVVSVGRWMRLDAIGFDAHCPKKVYARSWSLHENAPYIEECKTKSYFKEHPDLFHRLSEGYDKNYARALKAASRVVLFRGNKAEAEELLRAPLVFMPDLLPAQEVTGRYVDRSFLMSPNTFHIREISGHDLLRIKAALLGADAVIHYQSDFASSECVGTPVRYRGTPPARAQTIQNSPDGDR